MKNFLLLVVLAASCSLAAQTGTFYVAAKSGLSIREKPDAAAKVLDKIPYGTKVTLLEDSNEWVSIKTEGLMGYWRKVKYNNKTGYIVSSYLFTVPPPAATVKDMRSYIAQITQPFGSKLVVKSGSMNNVEEGGWELHKQLYKNGAEWHQFTGYEYNSDTYFLPEFTIQQAFLLLRLIAEFKEPVGDKDEFPLADKTIKKGEKEYKITVEKELINGDYPWVKKITIEYEEGAIYTFELFQIDNQVVIFLGAGV